ncbi:hypothetical protein H9660_14175 [Clostridium sp. Sa3CUN1]|uniref:Uncharacterized protein n=1 Tax=Clostridium gallinarum TaxID=2762246 RepID=A0ABR8Q7E0_9CLOT|nr:hypothetical protein [Clostridium gallinarum]MBD7916290.1 hypothetical protein [Clostridium gallinarum]
MGKKRLVEVEILNKVYKAIEIHLKIIEKNTIILENYNKMKELSDSINYLEEALVLLKPPTYIYKELKKEAYINYKNEKNKLEEMIKKNLSDIEIDEQKRLVSTRLRLYLAYKGVTKIE